MDGRDLFLATYKTELIKAITEHPEEYAYPVSEAEIVYARMAAAIERRSFNKDSRAFRSTCKALGIKHTYSAIAAFLGAVQAIK